MTDNDTNCKDDPGKCLRQVIVDGIVFAALYAALTQLVDKQWPSPDGIVGFVAIWVPIAFIVKVMHLEYADQLARVIGFQLGTKLFSIMSMP